MIADDIAKIRKKVDYSRGLRKILAETALVEKLALIDSKEALEIATASLDRARAALANTVKRKAKELPYLQALAGVLRVNAYALRVAKNYDQAEVLLQEATKIFRQLDDGIEFVRCMQVQYLIHRDRGELRRALQTLDEALVVDRQTDGMNAAALQSSRATLLGQLGEFDAAFEAFEVGLRRARSTGNILVQIVIQSDRAGLYQGLFRLEEAASGFQTALQLEREHKVMGDLNFMVLLSSYSRLQQERGEFESAIALCREGAATANAVNLHSDEINLVLMIANIQIKLANYSAALTQILQAYILCRAVGYQPGMAKCLAYIGKIVHEHGDRDEAERYFAESNLILQNLGKLSRIDMIEVLGVIYVLASSRSRSLNLAMAIELVHPMWELFRQGRNATRAAGIGAGLAMLQAMDGDIEAAAGIFAQMLELQHSSNCITSITHGLLSIGEFELECSNFAKAQQYLEQGLKHAQHLKMRSAECRLHELLAECTAKQGDFARAYTHNCAMHSMRLQDCNIAALARFLAEFEGRRHEQEQSNLQVKLQALHEDYKTLNKLAEARSSRIGHLTDILEDLHDAVRQKESETTEEYAGRIAELRQEVGQILTSPSWDEFEHAAQIQDDEFLRRLSKRFPNLTPGERKFCALLRLNHSSSDLCVLLNISNRSVQAYRYRIRKKMQLPRAADLGKFIIEF